MPDAGEEETGCVPCKGEKGTSRGGWRGVDGMVVDWMVVGGGRIGVDRIRVEEEVAVARNDGRS